MPRKPRPPQHHGQTLPSVTQLLRNNPVAKAPQAFVDIVIKAHALRSDPRELVVEKMLFASSKTATAVRHQFHRFRNTLIATNHFLAVPAKWLMLTIEKQKAPPNTPPALALEIESQAIIAFRLFPPILREDADKPLDVTAEGQELAAGEALAATIAARARSEAWEKEIASLPRPDVSGELSPAEAERLRQQEQDAHAGQEKFKEEVEEAEILKRREADRVRKQRSRQLAAESRLKEVDELLEAPSVPQAKNQWEKDLEKLVQDNPREFKEVKQVPEEPEGEAK